MNDKELQQIKDVAVSCGVTRCILFGSRAKGCANKGSDVDIAIIGDEAKMMYMLNEETTLPYFFDVINLEKIKSSNLIQHIERVGLIYFKKKELRGQSLQY